MSFAGKRTELNVIMFSKINQTEKDKYHMFSYEKSRAYKMSDWSVKWCGNQQVGEGRKERVKGVEYDQSNLYTV
jgi:hypothetical protein